VLLTNRNTGDTHNSDLGKDEDTLIDSHGEFNPPGDRKQRFVVKSMTQNTKLNVAALNSLQSTVHTQSHSDSILNSIDPTLNIASFSAMLIKNRLLPATSTRTRTGLSSEKLATKWKIPLKQAVSKSNYSKGR